MKRRDKQRPPAVWRKMKTVCIVVLLVCNALLLAVFAADNVSDLVLARRAYSEMNTILETRGVTCGSSVYSTLAKYPQAYTVRMDSGVQTAFADALLTGTVKSSADTGNTTVWTGENGTIRWAASGAVSASFSLKSQPEPHNQEDAGDMIRRLLDKSGIAVRKNDVTVIPRETEYTVEVKQYIGRTELLGCHMTFTIAEGNETTLDGIWCTGAAEPLRVRALESYSAQQMIFQLIAEQPLAMEIISAQPAYVLSDKSGGRFTAIPCWRFSTNAGDFVLNIITGDVVASADIGVKQTKPDGDADMAGSAFSE